MNSVYMRRPRELTGVSRRIFSHFAGTTVSMDLIIKYALSIRTKNNWYESADVRMMVATLSQNQYVNYRNNQVEFKDAIEVLNNFRIITVPEILIPTYVRNKWELFEMPPVNNNDQGDIQ